MIDNDILKVPRIIGRMIIGTTRNKIDFEYSKIEEVYELSVDKLNKICENIDALAIPLRIFEKKNKKTNYSRNYISKNFR